MDVETLDDENSVYRIYDRLWMLIYQYADYERRREGGWPCKLACVGAYPLPGSRVFLLVFCIW